MGGLGEAICLKLAAMGNQVVTTHSPANTRSADWIKEMKARGHDMRAVPVDVADFDSCQKAITRIESEVGPVDILVNNAGITRDMTFKRMGKVDWDAVLRNLDSVFNMTNPCATAWWSQLETHHQHLLDQRLEGRVGQTITRPPSRHVVQQVRAGGRAQGRHREHDRRATSERRWCRDTQRCSTRRSFRRSPSDGSASRRRGRSRRVSLLEEAAFVTGANIAINGGRATYWTVDNFQSLRLQSRSCSAIIPFSA
jgi:hypothetical protein